MLVRLLLRRAGAAPVIAPLRQKLESQGAGDRRGLDQAHGAPVAEPVGLAAAVADQRVAILVIAEIFAPDGARRNEAVGAGIVELDEQAGARDPRDVAVEGRADAVGEEMREQSVEGLALGLHGAPLGRRDARRGLAERAHVLVL